MAGLLFYQGVSRLDSRRSRRRVPVQLSVTGSPDNEVQLILSAIPETACQTDSAALKDLLDDLQNQNLLPSQLTADTAYGGDENHCRCRQMGIDLISPTSGKCPENHVADDALTAADFVVEEGARIGAWGLAEPHPKCIACPAGLEPQRSSYDAFTDQITIVQDPQVCARCPLRSKCPTRIADGWSKVTINRKQVRLITRRRREQTEEFKSKYRMRSGIESTNRLLKRLTGLGRLRVRSQPAVFLRVLLKVAGWNLLRAASVRSLLEKLAKSGATGQFGQLLCDSGSPARHAPTILAA